MEQVRCGVRGVFVAVSETASVPVVVLESGDGRQLRICIGFWEAIAINSALRKEVSSRPLTHDLFMDLMGRFSLVLHHLQIDSIEDGIFYAQLVISGNGHDDSLDCRPSDGMAVALKADAPIFVEEEVLADGGFSEIPFSEMIDLNSFIHL
jgi:uncharacterized protein